MSVSTPKNDRTYCKSIAKSISNIIRFSLDEDFRNSSFELFGVSSTKEIEKEISKRLMLIIENQIKVPPGVNKSKKKRKSLLHTKENQQELNSTLNENDKNSISSTIADDSQIFFQKFFKKNEPQISTNQYGYVIQKRNLGYFSQPEFNQSNQTDFAFSKSSLKCNHSQPSTTSLHAFYEEQNSSSEKSDEEVNYFQKMFTDSFNYNAQKYLKKNLKSYNRICF